MTSPLRRKRRTTVRNTPANTSDTSSRAGWRAHNLTLSLSVSLTRRLVATLGRTALAAAAISLTSVNAAEPAGGSTKSTGEVITASHNKKLEWRPARPFQEEAAARARDEKQAQRAAFDESEPPRRKPRLTAQVRPSNEALVDPFSDRQAAPQKHPFDEQPQLPSVQAREEAEPLIAPGPRDAPPPLGAGVEPVRREPLELRPPDPLAPSMVPDSPPRSSAARQPTPERLYQSEPEPYDLSPIQRDDQTPEEDCREAYDRLKANTIDKLSIDITVTGEAGADIPFECSLGDEAFSPRCWHGTTFTWKASALCHKPLYFEDVHLERYGHSHGPCGCEYLSSFAHFFGDVILLPYNVGVKTPCECEYSLGYYRPGSCAPYMCEPFPISLRGAATAAVGYVGTVFLFP